MAYIVSPKKIKQSRCQTDQNAMMWSLEADFPMQAQQFSIIRSVILSLSCGEEDFFTVAARSTSLDLSFIQIARITDHSWNIEINLKRPYRFSENFGNRIRFQVCPWTQYSFHTDSDQMAIEIFEMVLCQEILPDLKNWTNITKAIRLGQI